MKIKIVIRKDKNMNKKVIGIISILVLICVIGAILFFAQKNKDLDEHSSKNDSSQKEDNLPNGNSDKNDNSNSEENKTVGKILVVYYSATNNTKNVAEQIAKNLDADIFEIVPTNIYTSEDLDYNNPDARVFKEHSDESLRNVKLKNTKVNNWSSYDVVLIGYPIWWGIAAWPVNSFVKENNFDGKTIIPFCTSASSGLGNSGNLLAQDAKGGKWLEGRRFNSHPTNEDIKSFTDSIKQ